MRVFANLTVRENVEVAAVSHGASRRAGRAQADDLLVEFGLQDRAYALMTLGLVIVYGILRLVNFAYGELIMVVGYTLFLLKGSPMPWLVMAMVAVCVAVATGILTDYVAFRPVRAKSVTAVLVTSFAFSTLLQNAALLFISPRPRKLPLPDIFSETLQFLGLIIPVRNVVTIALALVLLAVFALLMRRTILGIAMRASATHFTMARMLGVPANVITSALMAGLAGAPFIHHMKQAVIPNIAALIADCRSRGVENIFARIAGLKADGRDRSLSQKKPGFNYLVLPREREDAQIVPELAPGEEEIVVTKTTDSALTGTNLRLVLRNMEIDNVIVSGIFTDQCVSSTVRSLADESFNVVVVEDCCAAATEELHLKELQIINMIYCHVVKREEVVTFFSH